MREHGCLVPTQRSFACPINNFVVAALVAGAVAAAILRVMGDTPTGKIAARVLPALVMVIALFMILQQLKIAEQIVQIAFGATMFALALGLALVFGLGGRPIAQKMLEDAYRAGQQQKEQMKQDLQTGRQRGQSEMSSAQAQVQSQGPPPTTFGSHGATDPSATTYGEPYRPS